MKNVLFVVIVILVVTTLLFFGKTMQHRASASCDVKTASLPLPTANNIAGTRAPDFELDPVPAGKPFKLSSLEGKAVMINFWATWCEPCKIEMPWLVDLQKEYGPQGFQIIGVAMDDTDDKTIDAFAHKMGVNYPVLKGKEKMNSLYPPPGGFDGLPLSYFVDRAGRVVDRQLGLQSESVLVDDIKKSLKQGCETPKTTTASAK